MGKICCLLDACTVINLIHIDEDDFLLKKIKSLELKKTEPIEIQIEELVFKEIQDNVNERLRSGLSKYSDLTRIKIFQKEINQKLSFFRGKKVNSIEMIRDFGSEYYERVMKQVGYTKKINGELCSTAYALYMSRLDEKKVFFYTDDYPAKRFFSNFFDLQQIGHIKDTVDFLILVYWLDDEFTEIQLDKILSDLYSQYTTEIVIFKNRLLVFFKEKVDGAFVRANKDVVHNLRGLLNSLEKMDFNNIIFYWEYFEGNKKCKEIFEILKQYQLVFEIEASPKSGTLLEKITKTREIVINRGVLKLKDLLES